MEPFVWPLAAVVFGVFCVLLFKAQIGRLLDRTKSVGKEGLRAYDDAPQTTTRPDPLAVFLEGYHSPVMLEIEAALEEETKKRGLTNVADANKALRKSLAGTILLLQLEQTDRAIFASQVAALNFLNGRAPAPTPEADLEVYFTDAKASYPKLYEHRTFQEWLGFLVARVLVIEAKDGVTITVRGREFLKWRVDEGRPGPFYG